MKYKGGNFCQLSKKAIEILNESTYIDAKKKIRRIPASMRWLYIHLNLLEHRFTGKNEDFFFRAVKDLKKDTGFSEKTIIEGIKKLNDLKLIHSWQMHWIDRETGKKTEKHITAFRISTV